ncbi:glutamate--tRNA ligase [Sandaracinus amylolyticus]|uniref:Glutamate--tRNA ligase n=1 Tax=Sandaracinus amylolyticus TaxID=927083 RepID=A0A0F6SE86_9BACT|nr:glutamate--tRNA ligase [Sandaracinus amylolyticus]AKF04759.1 Glutamyl-tRNA synthetase [Sandaracinus amylolyticus]
MTTKGDRVRFAPSPTGFLHIGGVRTALYNWLWARRTGGTFVLRIEDTDRERSTQESVDVILDSMKWCGLEWDEGPEVGGPNGPYFQTQRLELYRDFAEKLIARGAAFRCYCTKEELDAQRAKLAPGQHFRYPGTCRTRTDQPDRPYVIRMKSPTSGATGWLDLVKGRIDVPNDAQQDWVLMRGDGVPLYNFGAVVDDITMGITLIARGDDHVVNTPIQIILYEALGYALPKFAHLPMINGQDGKKLSKRHAAVSTTEYRDMGYLPDAVLNYLARLGWSHGDQEIFTRDELIQAFSWDGVGRTAAQYDAKKFAHVQASHLRALGDAELAERARPFAKDATIASAIDGDRDRYVGAVGTVKTRATTLIDIVEMVDFYFREPPVEDEKAVAKFLVKESAATLKALRDHVAKVDSFDRVALEASVNEWLAQAGLQMKNVAQPARVAMTGKTASPGLFDVMEVLGRERTLARLDRGIARSESAS